MDSKRQLQVGELIKRNFSYVLQGRGSFIYGRILVSVTRVAMTPDLALAKIYLSIYGAEDKEEVLTKIEDHIAQLKTELVTRIRKHVRRIPQITVFIDDTLDEMYRIDSMFHHIKEEE